MAATALSHRPLRPMTDDAQRWYQRINFSWILQRAPIILLSLVSFYGVQHFLYLRGTPEPFNWIGGAAFDVGFLGVIALTDARVTNTWWSMFWFYVVNITMAGIAALFNVLAHSGGTYEAVTAEDITVGLPFAVLSLVYALYYHGVLQDGLEHEQAQKSQASTTAYCIYCAREFGTKQAVYAHYGRCETRKIDATPLYDIETGELLQKAG